MEDLDLRQVIYMRALKVARQYLAPNTRLEVDAYLRSGLPVPPKLAGLVLNVLAEHERKVHNVR